MRPLFFAVIQISLALLAPALPAAQAPGQPSIEVPAVAWLAAASQADIERAFEQAQREQKPLLLYWGAKWCPPCNQLQATLFNRRDFIERSRSFVAVQLDGDLPGAQRLGARYKVRGYPTLVLFSSGGQEVTRLPGEADPPQVLKALQLGLSGGRTVTEVLGDAQAGRPLPANEWRMLAFYAWDTADEGVLRRADRADLLARLAAACPASEAQTRLWLKALAASDGQRGIRGDAALRRRVLAVLADPTAARAHMDVLTGSAVEIVRALDDGAARSALVAKYELALRRLAVDPTLSRADRMAALHARVELARLSAGERDRRPKLPPPLIGEVRAQAARMDREIADPYERQAVITAAAYVLGRAGLAEESDALLRANLPKSHSPYYLMSQLAANAKERGENAEALSWYERAFEASEGPATRLQWGASYLSALVDLAPDEAARIEQAAARLFAEAAAQRAAFHERSARSLQKAADKLKRWNAADRHAAALQRLQRQVEAICRRLDPADSQRAVCEGLLSGAPAAGS